MTDLLSKVRWGKVLLAGLATHVTNIFVAVLLIVVYTLLGVGPQREPSVGHVDGGQSEAMLRRCLTWLDPWRPHVR